MVLKSCMLIDFFFENVHFFFLKKQRTEFEKNFFTFRCDGKSKEIIYLGK